MRKDHQQIHDFLASHPIATLATVTPDGEPHAAVIYFAIDDGFGITFSTKRQTRKFENLMHHDHAMLTVYEASSQTTVQIACTATEITDPAAADESFRNMLAASIATSDTALPPITKVQAGNYVALRLRPVQIRMAVYSHDDPGGFKLYESIEFEP